MTGKLLAFDAALLLAFLATSVPAATGVGVHEWFGLALTVALVVHCAISGGRLWSHRASAAQRNVWKWVLSATLFVDVAVCAVSGLMVSGAVLPAFGLYAEGYFFWDPLHAVSAKVLLALLLVHVVVHGRLIIRVVCGRLAVREPR